MRDYSNNRQLQIYEFIKSQIKEKGYPPSVREICAAVGLRSTSTVHNHLERLEKRGLIKRDGIKSRTIEIIEKSIPQKEMIDIPIIGDIAAGMPILATENVEDFFPIPVDFIKNDKKLFILRVKGESMIDAGILNGDFSILEQTNFAENGDIVAALIGNEATLKRFFKQESNIRLQPENKNMPPIIVDDCKIIGKLVGVYRRY